MSKIVVGMSGGVDSAVAAHLLKEQGHDVVGVFMRNGDSAANNDILGNPNTNASVCQEELDGEDVKILGKQIGIPVKRVDFVSEYGDNVFKDLISQYKAGRTPNPDILCNKYIKFGVFYDGVEKNISGVDYVATGHYADIENGQIKKPIDDGKDQTYFLAQVPLNVLKKTIFPLAKFKKTEVRKIAKANNLIVASKKDSTGICFIGERNFTQFLQNYIPAQPGNVVDITTDKIIGKHIGAMYYTIGQRKGLNLGGNEQPYFVAGHDIKKKIIYVVPESDKKYLQSNRAIINDVNWIAENKNIKNVEVKFRYKSNPVEASIKGLGDNSIEVTYPKGFEAVTPGQQVVLYNNKGMLGGGVIDDVYYNNENRSFI